MPESNREEITKLEGLYASNPDGRVFTHLAEAYRKAGEYERARTILEQGLAKHPTYASAHVVLGRVFIDLNQPGEATESFRRVLQLDPHNLVALRSLGDLARAAGRNAEALGYFEELRHQDPANDELEGIIAELLTSPGPGVEAPQPFEPAPPAVAEAAPASEEEPGPEPLSDLAEAAPDLGDFVSPDVELNWAAVEADQEALPGDLASFAGLNASTTNQGTFGEVNLDEPVEDLPIDLGFGEAAEEPAEEYASLDFSDFGAESEELAAEPVEAAGIEETPFEAALIEAPPIEAPPIEAAPIEAAPIEEAPIEEAPIEEAPIEEVPIEEVPIEAAASEEAAFDEMPIEEAQIEEVPVEAARVEPVPIEAASSETAPSGEVLTETMAELYRNQGLHERAAEVYRALLQQRPDDMQLQGKLEEVEALARGESPAAVAAGPEAPPVGEEFEEELPAFIATAPEAVAEPVAEVATSQAEEDVPSPWTSSTIANANAPTPYAWAEEKQPEPEVEPGPPVSAYFRSLLSWRPAAPARHPEAEPQPEPEFPYEPEPAYQPEAAPEAESAFEFLDLGPSIEEPPAPTPPTPETAMPWEEEEVAAVAAPAPAPPPVPAAAPPMGDSPVEDAFDEWFGTPEAQPAGPSGAGTPEGGVTEEPAPEGEDDDDLEMFRSWLQSLKK